MSHGLDSSFDMAALAGLRHEAARAPAGQDAGQLAAAAKQFESLFTQMMLKSMRAAGEGMRDSAFSSSQGDFYQDMFDQQLALHLSKGRGLGLADVLIEQLGRGRLASTEPAGVTQHPGSAAVGHSRSSASPGAALTAAASARQRVINGSPSAATQDEVTNSRALHDRQVTAAESRHRFAAQMWPHARQVAEQLGVDAHAVLAQAALETGWGRHVPQAGARSSHNLFGIKADATWRGDSVQSATVEYEAGAAVNQQASFRAYDSPQASFQDYAALLSGRRYAAAIAAGKDTAGFAQGLQRAGYATDPDYARKVIALARQLRDMTPDDPVAKGAEAHAFDSSAAASEESSARLRTAELSARVTSMSAPALKYPPAAPLLPDGVSRTSALQESPRREHE